MILGPNLEVLSEIKFSIDLSTKKANPLFTVTTIGKPLFAEAPIRSAVVDLKSGYFKWRKALPKKPVEFGSLPFLLDQSTLREEYGFVELTAKKTSIFSTQKTKNTLDTYLEDSSKKRLVSSVPLEMIPGVVNYDEFPDSAWQTFGLIQASIGDSKTVFTNQKDYDAAGAKASDTREEWIDHELIDAYEIDSGRWLLKFRRRYIDAWEGAMCWGHNHATYFRLVDSKQIVADKSPGKNLGKVCFGGALEKAQSTPEQLAKRGIQVDEFPIVQLDANNDPRVITEGLDITQSNVARIMWEGKPMLDGTNNAIEFKFNFPKANNMMVVFFKPGRWRIAPSVNGKCKMP